MCGIAGLIHRGNTSNVGFELQGMLQALKHRGEDSTGYALYGKTDGQNFIMRFKVGENVGEGSTSVMEDVSVYDERKKIVDGYLSDKDKLPTIYDISRVQSFKISVPSANDLKNGGAAGVFNGWRTTVFDKYKKGEINIDTLMNDIDSLSVMEEVYEARKIIEDANASDPKYVSGSGYGFFENNVVLSVPNKPIN